MTGFRYTCLLIVSVILTNAQSDSIHFLDGKTSKLVGDYFLTKRITKLTAFVCWGKYNRRLMRELSNVGIQIYFPALHRWGTNATIKPTRGNNKSDWWPSGVILDTSCSNAKKQLEMAAVKKLFDSLHYWLIFHENTQPEEIIEREKNGESCKFDSSFLKDTITILGETQMLVNSEVTFIVKRKIEPSYKFCVYDVYRVKVNGSLIFTPIIMNNNRSSSGMAICKPRYSPESLVIVENKAIETQSNETKCFISNLPRDIQPTSLRRMNFHGATLLAGTVIVNPELYTGMHDLQLRHVDTWTKMNFILVEHMSQDLNFKLRLQFFDNWGYQTNGSFDGLVGSLERQELDLGATGVLIKKDRFMVIDYVGDTFQFRATMLFRQPSLASITNIFVQPFSTQVWLCAAIMLFIDVMVLTIELKVEGKYQKTYKKSRKSETLKEMDIHINWGDSIMMVVGAACQQGYYSPPSSLSARITFLVLWFASLFLFTSYAANVVALLQTPSHLVRSLADLLNGPMDIGIQDVIYNHVYFQETTDPLAKELYHKKIEPKHGRAYFGPAEGMNRVQKGLFAFQVEHSIGYKIISETFTEGEKCGLGDVQLLPTPILGIPIVRGSPYKEILAQKLCQLREVGTLDRILRQWVPQKPTCSHSHLSASRQFVSIRLEELKPSFYILRAGAVIATILLILEIVMNYYINKKIINLRFKDKIRNLSLNWF